MYVSFNFLRVLTEFRGRENWLIHKWNEMRTTLDLVLDQAQLTEKYIFLRNKNFFSDRVNQQIRINRDSITRHYAINHCYLVSRRTTWTRKLANRRHARRHSSAGLKPITRPLVWIHRHVSRTVTPVSMLAFLRLLIGPRIKVGFHIDTAWD